MMEYLTQFLFVVSGALLVPVIVALLVLAALTLMNIGGTAAEFAHRRRHRVAFARLIRRMKLEPHRSVDADDVPRDLKFVREALTYPIESAVKSLDDQQLQCEQAIGQLQIGVRLGPILGLVGTLIPLGPALMSLSSGDIDVLSDQLIVAFSTTVLGLTVGGVNYFIATVRRSWYNRDVSDLSFVLDRLSRHAKEL